MADKPVVLSPEQRDMIVEALHCKREVLIRASKKETNGSIVRIRAQEIKEYNDLADVIAAASSGVSL